MTTLNGVPPCPFDEADQPDCYWDAPHRANGEGTSFVITDGVLISCNPGEVLAEDLSCVPSTFWDESPTPTPEAPQTAPEAPQATPTPVEYIQTTQDPSQPLPDTLAATGMDDVSPVTPILAVCLILAGLAALIKSRRNA